MAGEDVEIELPATASLQGGVEGGSLDQDFVAWSLIEGPAPVAWEDSGSLHTQATFFVAGTYVLGLEVRRGEQIARDELLVIAGATPDDSAAMSVLTLAPRRLHATIEAIGVEWDVEGDHDHDAYGVIRYRRQGEERWRSSPPLMRIDYDFPAELKGATRPSDEPRRWNMIAGSALFLEGGAIYDIDVLIADPDGGFAHHEATVSMRREPELSDSGRVMYVSPGQGGGQGTKEDPFLGIEAADGQAEPGDVFILSGGVYDYGRLRRGGERGNPVVWRSAEGEEPIVRGVGVSASHIWLFDLRFERGGTEDAVEAKTEGVEGLVVRRCQFSGYRHAISAEEGASDWTIMDNVIVGNNDPKKNERTGEGVDLRYTSGHVVAYNTISRVADGVSYPRRDCDIYGNDIFDTSDDGIEPDYALANVRIWGNRLRRSTAYMVTFQPQRSGPWYFLYNHIHSSGSGIFKFNGLVDRNVLIHNTLIHESRSMSNRGIPLTSLWSRNNLFVTGGGTVIEADRYRLSEEDASHIPPSSFYQVDWRTSLDYDGFAWDRDSESAPLVWLDDTYPGVEEWAAAAGIETHGVGLSLAEDIGLPLDRDVIELPEGSAAIDAGEVLPGFHSFREVRGAAPDLGAYERGAPVPHYGARRQDGE